MAKSRRDFIKWVIYLGATAALPRHASPEEYPHDVLEGISRVYTSAADLSGNAAKFRAGEDAAFEDCMRGMWQEYNRSARYVRVYQDMGVVPAHDIRVRDPDTLEYTGAIINVPESYVSFFQYRRA